MEFQHILIVDDSATSRMIIKRCFQMAGFQESDYSEAEDGLKAMSVLQKEEIDLVVTDLNMPKMDGNTFIKKLRIIEKTKEMPVMVISSMGNDKMDKELRGEGVIGIIQKPISPEKVMEVLEGGA
jgi:two-component system, chemotaxis family, chemotaxis protein CheY